MKIARKSKSKLSEFAKWVKDQRERSGISAAQLADESELSAVAILNIESGRTKNPRPETVTAIEGAFRSILSGGAGPFGLWLRSQREAEGPSVPQLAERVGVSFPAIYNLESGRTQNPNRATREKIESVLGSAAPGEAIETAEKEAQVSDLGSLQEFDPYAYDLIPSDAGVYVLYDVSDRPIYVGRSSNIRKRIKTHHDRFWFKNPIVNSAAFINIKDANMRNQIEEILIKFLKSNAVINKIHVDRDSEQ